MTNRIGPSIVIVDADGLTPYPERKRAAAALTLQVLRDFAPRWGTFASVRAAGPTTPPRLGEWHLELRAVPDVDDALGYHDDARDGTPGLLVFPELCEQDGTSWTSCASHEILETLADPFLRRCAQAPDGAIWALEVCDAPEAYSYQIDGVEVSDFCTPEWFEPPADLRGAEFDHLGHCSRPFQILAGGYGQTYTPDGGWEQHVLGEMRGYRTALADLGLARGARRQRPL